MGFPQVEWVLLVVSCVMKALLGMGVSAAGNDVLWVALVCLNFPLSQKFVWFFVFLFLL